MRPTAPVPRTALVTGAAGGIGRATALRLAEDGCAVLCADLDEASAEAAAEAVRAAGGRAEAAALDVTDPGSVDAAVTKAADAFGALGVLVNSAGIGGQTALLDTTLAQWERTLAVNLTGTFLTSQAAARAMIAGGHAGRIVNLASVNAHRGGSGRAAYGASKGGVAILTKVSAVELAEHGITVNAVAPGPIDTEMSRAMHTQATREAYHRAVPLRRYGTPEEIADAIAYLASDRAGYVTATLFNVDGGWEGAGLMHEL